MCRKNVGLGNLQNMVEVYRGKYSHGKLGEALSMNALKSDLERYVEDAVIQEPTGKISRNKLRNISLKQIPTYTSVYFRYKCALSIVLASLLAISGPVSIVVIYYNKTENIGNCANDRHIEAQITDDQQKQSETEGLRIIPGHKNSSTQHTKPTVNTHISERVRNFKS